jgi:signal transduction histidine kinase
MILIEQKGLTSNFLLEGDEKLLKTFNRKSSEFQVWFSEAAHVAKTEKEKEILSKIKYLYLNYLSYQKQVVDLHKAGNIHTAKSILLGDMRNTFTQLTQECRELLSFNEKLMLEAKIRIEEDNRIVYIIMVGLSIVGITGGLVLGFMLSRSVTVPIYELVLKLKGATKNNIVQSVEIENENELEKLGREVKNIIERMKQINSDLEKSQELLMRSEKLAALGKIAAGIAHEIRNPLTAIKMLIYSIREDMTKNNPYEPDLEVITHEIERMESFIQNFLDFARPRDPQKSSFDLNQTIENVLTLLKSNIKKANLNVNRKYDYSIGKIVADQDQIKQVLMNLIMNSIESVNGSGEVIITTELIKEDKSKNLVKIEIKDSGSGVPSELLPSLFDPFVSTKESGSGLGLSIAHKIIEKHSGWIDVKNNQDKGVTFTIYLPQ